MKTMRFLLSAVFLTFAFISSADAQLDLRGSIAGEVMVDSGEMAKRVAVVVMDLNTLDVQTTVTNDFGYFEFNDLQFGSTFIVSVRSNRYAFPFPYQTVILGAPVQKIRFVGSNTPINLWQALLRGPEQSHRASEDCSRLQERK